MIPQQPSILLQDGNYETNIDMVLVLTNVTLFCLLSGIFAVFLTIGLFVLSSIATANLSCKDNTNCIDVERMLYTSIDFSVDPCDNFYRYTCTRFQRNYPGDAPFNLMLKAMRISLLSTPLKEYQRHGKSIALAGTFLYKCVRSKDEFFKPGGAAFILSMIGVAPEKLAQEKNFALSLVKLSVLFGMKLSINVALPVVHSFHYKRGKGMIIGLGYEMVSQFPLSQWFSRNSNDHFEMCDSLFEIWKENMDEQKAKLFSADCRKIEKFISDIYIMGFLKKYRTIFGTVPHKYMSIAELSQLNGSLLTSIMWEEALKSGVSEEVAKQINRDTEILLYSDIYLSTLWELAEATDENLRLSVIYYLLVAITPDMHWLDIPALKKRRKTKEIIGTCLQKAKQIFIPAFVGFHTLRIYPNRHPMEKIANNLTSAICRQFYYYVEHNSWMDKTTKEKAKERLDLLKRYIGLPALYDTVEKINKFPSMKNEKSWNQTTFPKLALYSNMLYNEFFDHLLFPSGEYDLIDVRGFTSFEMFDVNAFYAPLLHIFAILSPFLQKPMVSETMSRALLYGGLGHFIGHEISHAFDPKNGIAGSDGLKADWKSPQSEKKEKNLFKCISNYYKNSPWIWKENATFDEQIGENVADCLGNEITYAAFESEGGTSNVKTSGPLEMFSPIQQFALFNCFKWCDVRLEAKYALNDPHSPTLLRCNMELSILPQFSQAFKCSKTSRMGRHQNMCRSMSFSENDTSRF